ncbi:hypothetical protein SAMN05421760_10469 [Neptunomonas antarctica]|uniref:Uncharacterized protein n=1 Tax=Neptunomonas antarctica TaxID=619304 RepID=A0A1N7LJ07_9GAMM|nr:hypothetical protein SAMN05421760_10469 [Neptunomonas antarctica]
MLTFCTITGIPYQPLNSLIAHHTLDEGMQLLMDVTP